MKQKQTHRHREQACSCQRDYNRLGVRGCASAKSLQSCLTVTLWTVARQAPLLTDANYYI